jgi:hypothetical protein
MSPKMAGSRSLPKEMVDHLVEELNALIADRHVGKSQTEVGQALGGISQVQVSELLRGDAWGWKAVLNLSEQTGKSITELLGPTAPHFDKTIAVLSPKVRELLDALDQAGFGYSGKNLVIPALIRELRGIVGYKGDDRPPPMQPPPSSRAEQQAAIREAAAKSPLGKKGKAKPNAPTTTQKTARVKVG